MPIVRFEGSDESLEVGKGANLRRSLIYYSKNPYRGVDRILNCRGIGLCGTCQVEILEGVENVSPPSKMEQCNLKRPLARGHRLACQVRVYGDCVVRLLSEPAKQD